MNNIKKTCLGLLVATLAFGFSAFTTVKRGTIIYYYKTDPLMYPAANNPNGYSYFSEDRCEAGGEVCASQWQIGSNPIPTTDGTPLPPNGIFFITGSTRTGHFE